ncbi:hypothetical protein D1F64_17585 [Breoghania sp. L-A4]|nr:hypothetical protein D1F64_17585 [Breoghania sp. L-A4]
MNVLFQLLPQSRIVGVLIFLHVLLQPTRSKFQHTSCSSFEIAFGGLLILQALDEFSLQLLNSARIFSRVSGRQFRDKGQNKWVCKECYGFVEIAKEFQDTQQIAAFIR